MSYIINTILRTQRSCPLPSRAVSMCETGCIYREATFKHLRCPKVTNTSPCAAPCPADICDCKHLVKINPAHVKNTEHCLQ